LLAVDQRVGEAGDVARRLPDPRVHDDRGVDADDVVALLDHGPPPGVLDVPLQLDPERPVVPEAAEAPVDLARREDEPAPLAQVDDRVEIGHRYPLSVAQPARSAPGPLGSARGKKFRQRCSELTRAAYLSISTRAPSPLSDSARMWKIGRSTSGRTSTHS